jgi:hypothetical protein
MTPYFIKKYSKDYLEKAYKKYLTITGISKNLHIDSRTVKKLFHYYGINRKKKILTKEHKNLISKSLIGHLSPLKNKKLSKKRKIEISKATTGKNNPFYGKKHTQLTKKKMSINHANFKGNKNPFKQYIQDPDNKKRFSLKLKRAFKRIKKDPIKYFLLRKKRSEATSEAHIQNKLKSYGKGHKHGRFFSHRQKTHLYFRSSYELNFLLWCEGNQKIKSFTNCKLKIPYLDAEGFFHYYIPDFIINKNLIIEIKPEALLGINKLKMTVAKKELKNNYIVITEKDIKTKFKKLEKIIK